LRIKNDFNETLQGENCQQKEKIPFPFPNLNKNNDVVTTRLKLGLPINYIDNIPQYLQRLNFEHG